MTDIKNKRNTYIKIIYSVILILYPMVRVCSGLNVEDATYSPANFVFFDSMSGTWTLATYLANLIGCFFTHLPFGHTLLALNIYTSLIPALTAVSVLWFFDKKTGIHILFAGEMLALSLCWSPTTILYNYLTYLLFTLGALLLLAAIRDDDKKKLYFAGIVLGANILTRLPNVTEAALIAVLWFAGYVKGRSAKDVITDTLRCIAGYLAGFLIVFAMICIRFSPSSYFGMIRNMFAMTDKAADYKPAGMILAMFEDYLYAFRWIVFWVAGFIACAVLVFLADRFTEGIKNTLIKIAGCFVIFGLVIRLSYGRGMFSLRYYEYGCMYFWAVFLLLAVTAVSIVFIFRKDDPGKRILSFAVLVIVYITCIGSNNGLYPSVNNMFITAPYILWMICEKLPAGHAGHINISQAAFITAAVLFAGTFVQGAGFHFCNSFNDGIYGEKRDSYVTGYDITAHMRTTARNAETLQGLMDFVYSDRDENSTVILYGDIPGLGYLLDMPSALTTFWPDLDSYNYYEWKQDLDAVSKPLPYVIVTLPVAAIEGGDPEAIAYNGADSPEFMQDEKLADLTDFIHSNGYVQVYSNDAYAVYSSGR